MIRTYSKYMHLCDLIDIELIREAHLELEVDFLLAELLLRVGA